MRRSEEIKEMLGKEEVLLMLQPKKYKALANFIDQVDFDHEQSKVKPSIQILIFTESCYKKSSTGDSDRPKGFDDFCTSFGRSRKNHSISKEGRLARF